MYKMIPFEEAREKLIANLKKYDTSDEEISDLLENEDILGIKKDRWDRVMHGYIIDPDSDSVNFETMTVYKIFPTDKDLDMIQLPSFLLEKL